MVDDVINDSCFSLQGCEPRLYRSKINKHDYSVAAEICLIPFPEFGYLFFRLFLFSVLFGCLFVCCCCCCCCFEEGLGTMARHSTSSLVTGENGRRETLETILGLLLLAKCRGVSWTGRRKR